MVGGGANKIAIEQESFQCGHKFPAGRGFYDVTPRTGEESSADDLRGSVLAEEQYADFRRPIQDLPSDLNPIDVREPDIEHHEVRFKLHYFLERSQPISGFTNDLNLGCGCKNSRDKLHPGHIIVHNKDTNS
jgi:hypothetical protein